MDTGQKILVIDDSELVSKLLQEALQGVGYIVAIAMDANQGYAMAIDFHPDLILLDVQLPDVTGFELCRVIKNRETLRHIPIIMVTGTAYRTEDKVKGFQLGADDYIMKPFEMPELLERVQAVLRRSKAYARLTPATEAIALPAAAPVGEAPLQPEIALPEEIHETLAESEPLVSMAEITELDEVVPSAEISERAVPLFDEKRSISLIAALKLLMRERMSFPSDVRCPSATRVVLPLWILLAALATAASAGSTLRGWEAGLLAASFWALLVAVTVGSAALRGLPVGWSEAAEIVSLAGTPLLLRQICALVFTSVTTLSPFYFTASPALFMHSPWSLLRRADLFEWGSLFFFWVLILSRPQVNGRKANQVALMVWGTAILLAQIFEHWVIHL